VFPLGRKHLRPSLAAWLDLPREATLAAAIITLTAGAGLWLLAAGLRRHKRRAWQVAVVLSALIALAHLLYRNGMGAGITAVLLCAALIVNRRRFTAIPDTRFGRWRAVLIAIEILVAGVLIDLLLLLANPRAQADAPGFLDQLAQSLLALTGVSGPVHFVSPFLDDLTAGIGLMAGVSAVLLGGYLLLRSAEPKPELTARDVDQIRDLLAVHGNRDSLGYFALRRDKSAVFSPTGKAAITYRVLAGVALCAGDPLGDAEAWPGAIGAFLAECRRHGWVPAVLGCSERGATVWARHDLAVLELGDEAVVDATTFSLAGRPMRGVRQAVGRVQRSGYAVRVRRTGEIGVDEHAALADLADRWRGTETERGFSMALSRVADATDPDCVIVTAELDGVVRGMLQFVPWGADGLSLDLMRRDRAVPDNGLNELMIVDLLAACGGLGVRRVSLNFAMFRAALERGERIGAGPVAKLWARALRLGSRWWQIETLYRFNAKFRPLWVPRYLVYPVARDLPRIALAAMEAEGFGGRPPVLLRMLRR
jgi:lysyl-tRNA synthetase class 2